MPVRLFRPGKPNSGLGFLHTCDHDDCGAHAPFGSGVNFRRAMQALDKGEKEKVRPLLGKWFCKLHWRKK